MKRATTTFFAGASTLLLLSASASDQPPAKSLEKLNDLHASDFTQEQYHEPPFDQQIKIRLSGAEAVPLPGGLLDVKNLKVEMFSTNGTPQLTVLAPQCTYGVFDHTVSSAGHLEVRSDDGQIRLTGEGFWLRQMQETNWSLTISNQVRTEIDLPAAKRKLL